MSIDSELSRPALQLFTSSNLFLERMRSQTDLQSFYASKRASQKSICSATGEARTQRNAMTHGFYIPVARDVVVAAEIQKLRNALAPDTLFGSAMEAALFAAEAQFDLLHASYAKVNAVNHAAKLFQSEDGCAISADERAVLIFAQKQSHPRGRASRLCRQI